MNDALTNGHNAAAVHSNLNGLVNGAINGNDAQSESPTTPVSNNLTASDAKIDMDCQEPESDVRHEPMLNKIDRSENASIVPQVGTPLDPCASLYLLTFCRC